MFKKLFIYFCVCKSGVLCKSAQEIVHSFEHLFTSLCIVEFLDGCARNLLLNHMTRNVMSF